MTRELVLRHEFVEYIPSNLEDRTVYVSVAYATAVHRCCCGCGQEVVTPLSPTDWKLIFDGETISLDPSIGNWGFRCRSHYWIRRNRVAWAEQWSDEGVAAGRWRDRHAKARYFGREQGPAAAQSDAASRTSRPAAWLASVRRKLRAWWPR